MKQMKKTSGRSGLRALVAAVGVFAALAVVQPAAAQSVTEDCRCVDADGNDIEQCSCFRAPRIDALISGFAFGVNRPRLGISLDAGQAAGRDAEGVLVTDVLTGGPADEAGIREGDIITSLDGNTLTESIGADDERDFDLDQSAPVQRLLALARDLEPGQEVEVEYLRDGDRQTTMVHVEDLSGRWGSRVTVAGPRWDAEHFRDEMRTLTDNVRSWQSLAPAPGADGRVRIRSGLAPDVLRLYGGGSGPGVWPGSLHRDGLELAEVNPALGAYFGAEDGVLVTGVARSSGLGLEAGDVVLRIGERAVTTPDRFRRIFASYGDEEDINFHIMRDGAETVVTGRLRY
jgi:S1-C subfamily serine protease